MHFLLDGYNVLAVFEQGENSGENDLAVFLDVLNILVAPKLKFNIYFDGYRHLSFPSLSNKNENLKIFFSRDEEADDLIREKILDCPRETILVTRDREIIKIASYQGLKIWSPGKFIIYCRRELGKVLNSDYNKNKQLLSERRVLSLWSCFKDLKLELD